MVGVKHLPESFLDVNSIGWQTKAFTNPLHHFCAALSNLFFRSNGRTKSTLNLLKWSTLGLNHISTYVHYCKNTCGCKPQVHRADSKFINNAQEVEANRKI